MDATDVFSQVIHS